MLNNIGPLGLLLFFVFIFLIFRLLWRLGSKKQEVRRGLRAPFPLVTRP